MRPLNRYSLGMAAFLFVGLTLIYSSGSSSSAQAPAQDFAAALGRAISTQVVTLKVDNKRGEPEPVMGKATFDRPVEAYWLSVVGADIKFIRDNEKQVNRHLFSVDPFAKVINGKEVEISGKLGIRDGSGNFDDPYEGTLTVAVTAVLSSR